MLQVCVASVPAIEQSPTKPHHHQSLERAFLLALLQQQRYIDQGTVRLLSLIFIYLFPYLMTASQIPIVICISVTKQRWFVKFGRWKHHFSRYHEPSTSDHISSPLKDKGCRIISAKFTIV